MRLYHIILCILCSPILYGQIVTVDPAFPERDQTLTITYDANLGNGALADTDLVYAHTGLITNLSPTGTEWRYVVGAWGTADPRVAMTNIGNGLHQLSLVIDDFYQVPATELVQKLAFVFRNEDGSQQGKTASGGDIFYELTDPNSYTARFESPADEVTFAEIEDEILLKVVANAESDIDLFVDGQLVASGEDILEVEHTLTIADIKEYNVSFRAISSGGIVLDAVTVISRPIPTIAELPSNAEIGITRLDDNTIRCVLMAPGKGYAYVVGTFNDWLPSETYLMYNTPDGNYMWLDVAGIAADTDHLLHYLVDGTISVADPCSELVVDTWNDNGISPEVFPDIPNLDVPENGYYTWLRPKTEHVWQSIRPRIENEDMVIYEVLVRDFVENRSYQEILDTLAYLADLGINAIEFMPVNEFEGNESWGYNPSFHMALDKYYGTPEKFKQLVDACHQNGIEVILDVVYNHAFSQSPMCQLYWDAGNFRPAADNPFLNVEAKHPFNVGYDFNHESAFTREYVKRVSAYWLEEYNIDGFRFDLSKGFTQRDAMGNVGAWGNYDASRISILKDYADDIWATLPSAKIILEHFGDNDEEQELAAYGMMLWSNQGHTINDATMGFNDNSNFEWIDYKKRDWTAPLAVNYMESHDEERLMYKNLNFGRQTSSYSVRELENGLRRVEAASALFYAFPGPKMLWQFGEMGYDYSINRCENGTINENCRLAPKPIRWDYLDDLNRKRLVDVTTAIIELKTEHGIARDGDYQYNLNGDIKHLRIEKDEYDAVIISNFGMSQGSKVPIFPSEGTYYDYLTGDVLEVESVFQPVELEAGDYRIYVSEPLAEPVLISGVDDPMHVITDYRLYPNPVANSLSIDLSLETTEVGKVSLYSSDGQLVETWEATWGTQPIDLTLPSVPDGVYHLVLTGSSFTLTDRLVVKQ